VITCFVTIIVFRPSVYFLFFVSSFLFCGLLILLFLAILINVYSTAVLITRTVGIRLRDVMQEDIDILVGLRVITRIYVINNSLHYT